MDINQEIHNSLKQKIASLKIEYSGIDIWWIIVYTKYSDGTTILIDRNFYTTFYKEFIENFIITEVDLIVYHVSDSTRFSTLHNIWKNPSQEASDQLFALSVL